MIKKNFLETDKERAERIKAYCEERNIPYKTKPIHELVKFDFESLTDEQALDLKKYYEQLDCPKVEKVHRKWDDKFHPVEQEAMGYFTGANTEVERDM